MNPNLCSAFQEDARSKEHQELLREKVSLWTKMCKFFYVNAIAKTRKDQCLCYERMIATYKYIHPILNHYKDGQKHAVRNERTQSLTLRGIEVKVYRCNLLISLC